MTGAAVAGSAAVEAPDPALAVMEAAGPQVPGASTLAPAVAREQAPERAVRPVAAQPGSTEQPPPAHGASGATAAKRSRWRCGRIRRRPRCTAVSAGEAGAGSVGLTAVPASAGVAGRLPPIEVIRNALILPASLTTNTMLPTTTGVLLMRTFPVDARAASAPVALSSQCT